MSNEGSSNLEAEVKQLRELAARAVVAYHLLAHASSKHGCLYSECQEPFCLEAKDLGLV